MPKQFRMVFVIMVGFVVLSLSGCPPPPPLDEVIPPPPAAKVVISSPSGTVGSGETFTRTVEAQNIGNTFYVAFDVTYDPAIIEFQSAAKEPS